MTNSTRIEQLKKLLAIEPDDAFLNFGLAMELAKCQDYDASLACFGRVLAIDPNYVAAHFHKAKTLVSMGDIDAAQRELQAGIAQAAASGQMHPKGEMEEMLATL